MEMFLAPLPSVYIFLSLFVLMLMIPTTETYLLKLLKQGNNWDCVAAVERLPALHYSVDFIFLSFGIMGFAVEL